MAKKSSLPLIYLIGVALVAIGFCLPMFSISALGFSKTANGFNFISSEHFNFVNCGALLIFCGAVAGIVLSFLSVKNASTIRLICLLVSIAGGIVLVIGFNQDSLYKVVAKGFLKHAYVGFYVILAGWVVGLAGALTKK